MDATAPSTTPDLNHIMTRAKEILVDPKGTWPKIKAEPGSIRDVYFNYLFIIAAIPALATFIKMSVIGNTNFVTNEVYRVPITVGLIQALISYGMALGMTYVFAWIAEMLAGKFEGNASRVDAFKWLAYTSTAQAVAGLLSLLPSFLGMLSIVMVVYGIYILFTGITPMLGVSESKRLPFFGLYIVIGFVFALIVGGLFMVLGVAAFM